MLNLVCANALENAKTFPHQIDLAAVSQMYYDYGLLYNQQGEVVLDLLQKQDREPELQKAIAESLEKSKHPGLSKRIMKWIAIFDQRYNDRRFYRWTFQMTNTEDRNWLFKFLLHNGLLK